jgi:hypothetical protein
MQPSNKYPFPPYTKGMVREAAVDSNISPADSLELSVNMHGDIIGAMKTRGGLTILGTNLSANPVLGMFGFQNNAGTVYRALAMNATSLYAWAGSSWAAIRTSLVSGSKMRYTNFVDYVFMVNGSGASGDAIKSYDGTSVGVTNLTSAPAKGDDIENYRSRLWVLDSSIDKVYYSDVVATDNTITWSGGFIQVSPNDGDKTIALKKSPGALLVFKRNHIYRITTINLADPDPKIFVGTYSKDSIIESKQGIHFHHPTGFFTYVEGSQPVEVSRPIIDFIKAIPRTYYDKVSGWSDDDHLNWSIGDITMNGETFNNVVCNYCISTKNWTVYATGTEIRSAAVYDDGTNIFNLVGDDVGNVSKWNTGNDDNGTPIFYDLRTHWTYLANLKRGTGMSKMKAFMELAVLHENAHGASLSYQLDSDAPSNWRPCATGGSIDKDLVHICKMATGDFTRVRLRLSGSNKGSPLLFRGWEIMDLLFKGDN